jgi:sugar phosphate isomerase/epimerase
MTKIYLLCLFVLAACQGLSQKKIITPEIGTVQNIENDSLLQLAGFSCLVESSSKLLSPRNVTDEQFLANVQRIKKLRVPLYACNLFIPGDLKVVGPKVDEKAILAYVEVVLQRAKAADIKLITWGSGGSRGVPEGFDRAKAKEQFIYMAKKVAAVAAKYDVILALENLNKTECNFINALTEALDIVKAVDHKNFRLCVDIYHMLKDGDSPASIKGTKKYAVYCEVAEKEGRTPPGVHGDDFTPYFAALKQEGYNGKIVIECRWENLEKQGATAYQVLRKQIDAAYK